MPLVLLAAVLAANAFSAPSADPPSAKGGLSEAAGRMSVALKGAHNEDPDQDLDEPRGLCEGGVGLCYTPGQIRAIDAMLASGWPDVRRTAAEVMGKPDRPARQRELDEIVTYLGSEQDGITFLRGKVGEDVYRRMESDPERRHEIVKTLPEEDRQRLRGYYGQMVSAMKAMTQDHNLFREKLLGAGDPWTAAVVKALDLPTPGQAAAPKDPKAWALGAQASLKAGDPRAAEKQARKALALAPADAQALSALAAARYDLKDYRDAVAAATRALAVDPADEQAAAVAKLAHAAPSGAAPSFGGFGDFPDAGDAAPSAIGPSGSGGAAAAPTILTTTDPASAAARSFEREAVKALVLGDFAAAEKAAERALAVEPGSGEALALRAYAELRQGRLAEALKDARAAGERPLALQTAAAALLRQGRADEGLLAARQAVAAEPRRGHARFVEAEAFAELGDKPAALEALKQAAVLDPRYRPLYDAALQAPQESDLAFLFPDVKIPQGLGKAAPAVPSEWLVISAGSGIGALLAFGAFWLFVWRRR